MQGTCQDMAEAVSTVIAAWETKPLPESAAEVAATPAVKEAASPPTRVSEPTAQALQSWQVFAGAGAGAALVGGTAATGGVDIQVGRATSHWQLRLALAGEMARQVGLLGRQVDWTHTTASLGLCWRLRDPFWLLSLDAGPASGWATLAGSGFSLDRRQRAFEYGVAAGLRAGRRLGRWTVWAEWRTTLWAQVQRATVTGDPSGAGAELSQIDTAVALGLSVMLFR
jgi:hypothetical protein